MRPHALFAILIGAAGVSACDETRQAFGLDRTVPDEFAVVTRAPLSMPPDYTLPPPTPGAPRPQEASTRGQAERLVFGQAEASAPAVDPAVAAGEDALLSRAGADSIEPGIRRLVNEETTALVEAEDSLVDSLIFWQERIEPGTVIDPQAEAERLATATAQGQPLNEGDVPVVQRRRRALLEGIF